MCINCERMPLDERFDAKYFSFQQSANRLCESCACAGCSEGNCCGDCQNMESFAVYQQNAAATARGGTALHKEQGRVAVACMGLAGEAGEVVDYLKKWVGHGHDIDKEHVKKELGDVLWYVSEIATALGLSLQEIAMMNADKLRKRYPEGFAVERSRNRGE